jgi:asparagine synthase (glutamine-hydrolysing)
MCGICGIVDNKVIVKHQIVRKMQNALKHRGPDDDGEFLDRHISMAMRRLSIIDIEGGKQPLYNEDKSLVLVANGEIYNYIELRARLKSLGHKFRTGSDCETILHLYEEYGAEGIHHLRGMFSFALWDTRQLMLLLVRDRMGEKPLYLYQQDDQLIFASELKALLQSGLVPIELDPAAIDLYFHYQYVPEPKTPIKGVLKLEAGEYLRIQTDPWKIEKKKYWHPEAVPSLAGDPAERIRADLEEISNIIIRSDVPVGVALSGGIDSSAVTALCAARYPDIMHAFTIGYPGRPSSDERTDAKILADHLNIPFHDIELSTEALVEFFPSLIYWSDEPIADIAAFAQYAIARTARHHGVPVLLSGLGGDELFWGYPWLKEAVQLSIRKAFIRRHLPFLFQILSRPARHIPIDWIERLNGSKRLPLPLQKFLGNLLDFGYLFAHPMDQMVMYDRSKNNLPDALMRVGELYTPQFSSRIPNRNCFELFTKPGEWGNVPVKTCSLEFDIWLRSNCLNLSDRLSMASSVEMRLPLIDHRLVETVLGLRKSRTDHRMPAKVWLVEAIRDLVPLEVLSRPKKGFTPPVAEWICSLSQKYWPMVQNGYLVTEKILLPSAVQNLHQECLTRRSGLQMMYKILVLEMWCRQLQGSDNVKW